MEWAGKGRCEGQREGGGEERMSDMRWKEEGHRLVTGVGGDCLTC